MTKRLPVRCFPVLLLLIGLAAVPSRGQRYSFYEYSDQEGLDSSTITSLLQDRAGYLWVGTENGLFRYDGSKFLRIGAEKGLLGTYVTSLYEDPEGELWVGTTIDLFHGNYNRFDPVIRGSELVIGTPGEQLASLGPGKVLAISHRHLVRLVRDGNRKWWQATPFFSSQALAADPDLNEIRSVFVDRRGDAWMGCGSTLCQQTTSGMRVWGPEQGIVADAWSWFFEDSSGRIWARGFHHIRLLSPKSAKFADVDIPSVHDTYSASLVPIVEDARKGILTRTAQGLAIWRNGKWQTVGSANGLRTPGIQALLVDHDGCVWIGTYGKGVQRWLGYGNWETWAAGQNAEENPLVWSLARDRNGTLWAATESGIVTFDRARGQFEPWRAEGGNTRQQVVSVAQARDRSLWFSESEDRVLRYEPATGEMQHWSLPDVRVRGIRTDSSGRVWILTGGSIYAYDSKSRSVRKVDDSTIPNQVFYDACEDSHHDMYFSSAVGVTQFSNGRWHNLQLRGVRVADGFTSIECSTDGTLWLGRVSSSSDSSLIHMRVTGDVATLVDPQPSATQLPYAEIMFVRHDRRGWLWVGSGSGVYVFNGNRWRHITARDGLAWNDTDESAFFEDVDGSIWIGTANGLSHLLHPEELFVQHPLRIIGLRAAFGNTTISPGQSYSFAWTHQPLQVDLTSSAIEDQSSIVYRYRLAGIDQDWSSTSSPSLRYPSLPDGTYRLEVFAEDTGQGARSDVATISFRIRPPWWKSLPFELIWTALLLLLVYFWQRFRERGMIARQNKLELLVRERTRELETEKQQLAAAREALREQATRDALTGLLNHGAIWDILSAEIERSQRDGRALTIVLIDIDYFKQVNDRYGHLAGDEVLRQLAIRLKESIRPYDSVGRYGGEEFLLVLPNFDSTRDVPRVQAIHQAICGPSMQIREQEIEVTCSFGVSVHSGRQSITVEQILDRADKALYKAKEQGRNRVESAAPEADASLSQSS